MTPRAIRMMGFSIEDDENAEDKCTRKRILAP
jgi:hypothetical protein